MIRRVLVVTVWLLVAAVCTSANPTLVESGDPLSRAVRRLSLAAGSVPPPAVSPLTYSDLRLSLSRINAADLSPRLRREYARLLSLVRGSAPPIRLGLDGLPWMSPDKRTGAEDAGSGAASEGPADEAPWQQPSTVGLRVSPEAYLHSGGDSAAWRYRYPDRLPLLGIPLRFRPIPALYLGFNLDWRKNRPLLPGEETVNEDPASNVPFQLPETDVQFPSFAVTSLAGERWSLQLGRDRLSWGVGHSGSLLLSDHNDYYDFLSAAVLGDVLTYRALYVDLEPWRSMPGEPGSWGNPVDSRMFFVHRIELTPAPWLTLVANDGFIYAGPPLELRYANPLMLMHNWFIPSQGNSLFAFELDLRPLRGLELSFHLAVDQFQNAAERERDYGRTEPDAFGYLANAEYVRPLPGVGNWLTLGTEWVYMDPWMYIGRTELTSFTYRRRVQAENAVPATKVLIENPLGYPLGPDSYAVMGYGRMNLGSRLDLRAELRFTAKGDNTTVRYPSLDAVREELPNPRDERRSPSGPTPEYVLAGRLHGKAELARFMLGGFSGRVSAGAIVDIMRIENNRNHADEVYTDMQLSPHVGVQLLY